MQHQTKTAHTPFGGVMHRSWCPRAWKSNRLIGYAGYLISLWPFGALNNIEFNLIAFFEALIAFALYGCVMDEYVGALIATEETVPFCVVEPLHCSLVLCHVPNSLCSLSSCADWNRHLSTHCDAEVAARVFWRLSRLCKSSVTRYSQFAGTSGGVVEHKADQGLAVVDFVRSDKGQGLRQPNPQDLNLLVGLGLRDSFADIAG